jgi:hypothetical protein
MIRVFVVLGIWCSALGLSAPAQATAGCEPRSAKHTSEHGGLIADSAWHVARGERPTCNNESSHDETSRGQSDPGGWPKRDRLGFHCTWRGCG